MFFKKKRRKIQVLINSFTAIYKCTLYAGGNKAILILYYVTYNFIQNHNYWRDLDQIFSCMFETFGSMSEISFLIITCHKNNFSTAENTCLLLLST